MALLFAWLTLVALPLTACSGEAPQSGAVGASGPFPRVTASDRLYGPGDLKNAGMKVAREYDVSGLPNATAALNGFLNRTEYEARFYATHGDAVSSGAAAASLATGANAIVTGNAIPWAEGATDRRKCVGAINANCVAKYGDFAVFGNMVLLCEGRDSATALAACRALLAALP